MISPSLFFELKRLGWRLGVYKSEDQIESLLDVVNKAWGDNEDEDEDKDEGAVEDDEDSSDDWYETISSCLLNAS